MYMYIYIYIYVACSAAWSAAHLNHVVILLCVVSSESMKWRLLKLLLDHPIRRTYMEQTVHVGLDVLRLLLQRDVLFRRLYEHQVE